MSKAVFLAATLVLVACSGKKDEERVLPPEPAPVAPTPGAPSAAPTTAPAAAPQLGQLPCESVVPELFREAYLDGAELTSEPGDSATATRCVGTFGDAKVTITADCPEARAGTPADAAKLVREQRADLQELPGVGAAALTAQASGEPGSSTIVVAWDDDSACQIEVNVPASINAVALAKDLLTALPPPAEGAAPAAATPAQESSAAPAQNAAP